VTEVWLDRYRLPDDELSLEEHLWLDLLAPTLRDVLRSMLKDVITDSAKTFVDGERSERVWDNLRGETVKLLVHEVLDEVLDEVRSEDILTDLIEHELSGGREGDKEDDEEGQCTQVVRELITQDENDARIHNTQRDTKAVEEAAAAMILDQAFFHHLLSMLGTQGAVLDIEDFLGGAWCNQLIAQAVGDANKRCVS